MVGVRAIDSHGAADLPFLAAAPAAAAPAAGAPAAGAPEPAVPRTDPAMVDRLTALAEPRPTEPSPVRSRRASEPAPPAIRSAPTFASSAYRPLPTRPEPGVWRPAALPPRPLATPLPRSEGSIWPSTPAPTGEGVRTEIDLDPVIDAVVAALTDRLDQAVAELGLDPAD